MPDLGFFEDDRGVIADLIAEPLDGVTRIFTRKGAVRGNHVHRETTQWTYVVSGSLVMSHRKPGDSLPVTWTVEPGELVCDNPGVAHAWRALEDTVVLVFTRGPRSGANYEDDVHRLHGPERLIEA
jgi:quercetin dioxygenase-like cupin family protein